MPANNAAFVGDIPENYDRYLGSVLFDPYAEDLVSRLSVPERATVMELACGTGIVTRRLREKLGPHAKLVATDLNHAMLDYAKRKFEESAAVEWKQADATDLQFPDQMFDAVVCQFGVMFFPDKEQAARETYRVLKLGGSFLFSVWDAIELNDLPNVAHSIVSGYFQDNPPDFYQVPFSFYDHDRIKSLLTGAGFREIQLSIVSKQAISPSARDAAHGLLHGNPIVVAIKERDESKLAEIEAAVAAKLAADFGAAPVRGRMQATVCRALK
jgi:ubiquinone/menaquinone biosynthesis C-methylase UbiE